VRRRVAVAQSVLILTKDADGTIEATELSDVEDLG
jgi:hypothetical protein